MEANVEHQTDYTLFLTSVQSLCIVLGVARLRDIVRGIGEQAARQHKGLVSANDELSKLREAARRFRELEESVRSEEESLKIGLALLFNVPQKVNLNGDAYNACEKEIGEMEDQAGVFIEGEDLDLSSFPLWKVMREILKQTTEIRVYELESHLKSFGIRAARSAIESALTTHRKDFKIAKRGREKFVSLK